MNRDKERFALKTFGSKERLPVIPADYTASLSLTPSLVLIQQAEIGKLSKS
jgi:hypothetical protein